MLFEDLTKKENIYDIARALEKESTKDICNENQMLADVFNKLDKIENGQFLKRDVMDVLELSGLNFFVRGMKMGVRLNTLLTQMPSEIDEP